MGSTILTLAAEGVDTELQLLPAIPELIWGFVAFAILFAVISGRVFPQLNATLKERQAAIQGKIEDAEGELVKAEQARREYEAKLVEANTEAAKIIDDAKGQAETVKADIIARAEEEAAAIRARATTEAAGERDRALQELRGQVASISVDIASKIVGAEVDQSRHDQLVDSYITQLSNNN